MKKLIIASLVALLAVAIPAQTATAQRVGRQKEVKLPLSGNKYETNKKFFRAVQSGTSKNPATAKTMAIHNAKVLMASNIEATMKAVTDQYTSQFNTAEGLEDASKFEQQSREAVKETISDITVFDEKLFMDKKSGTYTCWVAIEMPKESLVKGIKAKTKDSIKGDQAKFQEIFDKEMDALD